MGKAIKAVLSIIIGVACITIVFCLWKASSHPMKQRTNDVESFIEKNNVNSNDETAQEDNPPVEPAEQEDNKEESQENDSSSAETENTDSDEATDGQSVGATTTCYGGMVEFTLLETNQESNTITIRIQNNLGEEVRTFGLPSVVVDGESIQLDQFANMSVSQVGIVANSYADITYTVDASVFNGTSSITGKMWVMDASKQDNIFSLNIQ
ncbi:MAG: hypothetical protein EOM40_01120 [Clostridia bacterium]|nr:hypothetical protein [Clostridia bacterium]NCC43513.1 hypothetical protein [Clostridia bacterium]